MRLGGKKAAMLAAVSALAASAALTPAHAAVDPAGYPVIVAEAAAPVQHGADAGDHDAGKTVKKWTLLAIAAGALAGIVRLAGPRRVARAVAVGAARTASVAVSVAGEAAKAVGGAAASPLRYVSLAAGFGLLLITGADLANLEWLGALLAGALLSVYGLFGMWKTARRARAKVASAASPVKENQN